MPKDTSGKKSQVKVTKPDANSLKKKPSKPAPYKIPPPPYTFWDVYLRDIKEGRVKKCPMCDKKHPTIAHVREAHYPKRSDDG